MKALKQPFNVDYKAKLVDVNAYKALMDSTYVAVKQNVELTEGETPIFKQLDIDVIA